MKQNYKGCNVRDNRLITVLIMFTAVALSISGMGQSTELPPLTHSLTAINNPTKAPILRLQNMNNEIVDIKDLKGKTVALTLGEVNHFLFLVGVKQAGLDPATFKITSMSADDAGAEEHRAALLAAEAALRLLACAPERGRWASPWPSTHSG